MDANWHKPSAQTPADEVLSSSITGLHVVVDCHIEITLGYS